MIRQKIDLELITKIKNGDSKAVIKIYDYYKDKVTRFILKKYPKDTYREDNVSEILIKVFENIDKYSKDKAKFNTWVLSIAKNHMLDTIKKKQPIYTNFASITEISLYTTDTITSSCSFTYDGQTMTFSEPISTNTSADYQMEINESVNQICSTMSNNEFSMLSMKYIDGYNYNEIGDEFNLTSEEVSNKINYYKKKLSKKLKGK